MDVNIKNMYVCLNYEKITNFYSHYKTKSRFDF